MGKETQEKIDNIKQRTKIVHKALKKGVLNIKINNNEISLPFEVIGNTDEITIINISKDRNEKILRGKLPILKIIIRPTDKDYELLDAIYDLYAKPAQLKYFYSIANPIYQRYNKFNVEPSFTNPINNPIEIIRQNEQLSESIDKTKIKDKELKEKKRAKIIFKALEKGLIGTFDSETESFLNVEYQLYMVFFRLHYDENKDKFVKWFDVNATLTDHNNPDNFDFSISKDELDEHLQEKFAKFGYDIYCNQATINGQDIW